MTKQDWKDHAISSAFGVVAAFGIVGIVGIAAYSSSLSKSFDRLIAAVIGGGTASLFIGINVGAKKLSCDKFRLTSFAISTTISLGVLALMVLEHDVRPCDNTKFEQVNGSQIKSSLPEGCTISG